MQALILDSGVGGLSVVRSIRATLPELKLVYLADNAWFPYGGRDETALIERLLLLVEEATRCMSCDAIVIACNTASTVALDALRAHSSIPIVGVVPPIKTAGEVSRTRIVGLLATEATVQRDYVRALRERYAADCQLISLGLPRLAEMAEAKLRGVPVDRAELRGLLSPLFGPTAPPVDTVVLGCTHYPLLLEELGAVSPPDVRWLDSSPAIARRLAQVLTGHGQTEKGQRRDGEAVYFTAVPEDLPALEAYLHELALPAPKLWPELRTAPSEALDPALP